MLALNDSVVTCYDIIDVVLISNKLSLIFNPLSIRSQLLLSIFSAPPKKQCNNTHLWFERAGAELGWSLEFSEFEKT
jgi:hypothetical protein